MVNCGDAAGDGDRGQGGTVRECIVPNGSNTASHGHGGQGRAS
jgi:hypothetical protein